MPMSGLAVKTTDFAERTPRDGEQGNPVEPSFSPLQPISPWPPIPQSPSTESDPASTHHNDQLPNAKEIYGLIAVLGTYLAFLVYLVWALCPDRWLTAVGWTWYPSRDWAVVVPCYLMLIVLLVYWSYAALSAFLTPSFDSAELITDRHCNIPPHPPGEEVYYWKFADPDTIPEAVDLPIDLINRVLYPPRPRRSARVGQSTVL